MNKNEAELVAKNRAMSVAFRESILEASEEELRQALRDEGRDFDEEAARAQDVIERAFQQAGVELPTEPREGSWGTAPHGRPMR
jgi:predicted phage gp36 major capsid-like protein